MQPYREMLAHHGVTQSISRKGNCFDNAAIESFFRTLKAEYFHHANLGSLEQLQEGVDDNIRYFNQDHIKLKLNGLSPLKCRLRNIEC